VDKTAQLDTEAASVVSEALGEREGVGAGAASGVDGAEQAARRSPTPLF